MGYEDRDYFQSRPGVELSFGTPRGTLTMLIVLACAFFACAIVGDTIEFEKLVMFPPDGGTSTQRLLYDTVVLQPRDAAPWAQGFAPAPWKLLTHWLVAPGLFQLAMALIGLYFVGRLVEQFLGLRRFIGLMAACGVLGGLGACAFDGLMARGRPVLIMGPSAAVMGLFASVIWLAPEARTFMNWKLKNFVIVLLVIFLGWQLLATVASQGVAHSATSGLFSVGVSAAYMQWLKRRGRLPQLADLSRGGARVSGMEPDADPLERSLKQSIEEGSKEAKAEREQRESEARDRARVDALLAKISEKGIHSLSRADRKFLDAQSKKKK